MNQNRGRPAPSSGPRGLPSGPVAFVVGTADEVRLLDRVCRQAGLAVDRLVLDPPTLDIEAIVLDEQLEARISHAAIALVLADVVGDDRLPLIAFIDESLGRIRPLLVSCTQAGATE